VVIDGTKYQQAHHATCCLCDSIVLWTQTSGAASATFAVTVELKGGKVPTKAAAQLQEGAKIVEALGPPDVRLRFAALIAKGRRIHPEDYKVLLRKKVRFRSRDYPIRLVPCGFDLSTIATWGVSEV